MHRLFVAIRPPAAIRAQLLEIMGGVMAARWQSDEQLHLTLRFIGSVNGPAAEDIAATLGKVKAGPIEVAINGLGVFDRKAKVETLWAGVEDAEPLAALHRKIDRAVVSADLEPERRTYKPHVTLARFGIRGGDVGEFLVLHRGLSLPPFTATAFHLYESHTHAEGVDYSVIETYPLGR